MRRKTTTNASTTIMGVILYGIGVAIVPLLGYAIVVLAPELIRFTLPIMGKYEYIIDKHGTIHGTKCPLKKSLWFKVKHKKYDIIMETDQTICTECLLFEKDKLWLLHKYNLKQNIKHSISLKVGDEYIKTYIEEHSPKYED